MDSRELKSRCMGLPVVPGAEMPGPLWISAARTLAAALAEMGYAGTVGLEAWAADGDSDRALDRFRAAFTI